jgi:hypothetical protein
MSMATVGLAMAGLAITQAPAKPDKPAKAPNVEARLTLSIDMSLQDRWFHSPGELGVSLAEAKSVVRGQSFAAYVFFSDLVPNDRGEVAAEYDLRVTKPSGRLHRSDERIEGHSGPKPDEPVLLADQVLKIAFEPKDELGTYKVTLTVRDRVNGTKATVVKTIDLVEHVEGAGFADEKALDAWIQQYYRAPQPERAIAALLDAGRFGAWKDGAAAAPVFHTRTAFFQELFASNAWLFEHLLPRFDTQVAETKPVILRLLSRSSYDAQAFAGQLKGADAETWKKVTSEARHDPLFDPVAGIGDVHTLWGTFFASGKYAPILRLCEALANEETHVISDDADVDGLKKTVAESIRAQVRTQMLVKNYCSGILSSDTIQVSVRDALRKVLVAK